ncbi:RNA polymerase sigma factor [Gilvimarinus sp. DA14]|uniref:RNA polymerase sigma factor n=1 Tax=Gilvimarinus sp. DA14 TaxID=2956798 RepID=UPI0020B6B1B5|nr:sigma-70 family RNA polymerase sigma factor [Gilvimarinus sp. DA14]UTF59892.1 sigma-70 family RNA polymerase sigma factor [Gilvimarinus sp. DA14]
METTIAQIYQQHSRQVLATLIRLLRDFDLAEEALHDAFTNALLQWPTEGIPDNPTAWLVSTGRFKAIDKLRKYNREAPLPADIIELEAQQEHPEQLHLADDRLRLIFTCCHPSLNAEAATALTLREICDLSTEEIASAYLSKPATIAQRIVRAKRKIQTAGIPYEVPGKQDLPERLPRVLQVVYLIFNEGYHASGGDNLLCKQLAEEAIRLGRLIADLLPEPEVLGLLALMLLQHSRRDARSDARGDIVLLQDQDRELWHQSDIAEALALVPRALVGPTTGPYALQAAIAALHAEASSPEATDWQEIHGLYHALYARTPTPVVALNLAVAQAMAADAEQALLAITQLAAGELKNYCPAHAARAELLHRLGRPREAAVSYRQALALSGQAPEQRYIQKRLRECEKI